MSGTTESLVIMVIINRYLIKLQFAPLKFEVILIFPPNVSKFGSILLMLGIWKIIFFLSVNEVAVKWHYI